MRERQEFTSEVERLDDEGRGIAHRDGKVVFIEGGLPGETVRWARLRNKPSYDMGTAVRIESPCAMRVKPRCPSFGFCKGSCGGCAMQHLEASAQVAFKQAVLEDALWHIGRVKAENLLPPIYGPFWHYRQRARLTVRNIVKKGGVLVGFHEKHSSYVADMVSCAVLPEHVSDMLPAMREVVSSLAIADRVPQIEVAAAGDATALVFRILEPLGAGDAEKLLAFGENRGVDIWLQPKGPDSAAPMVADAADRLALRLPEFDVSIVFRPADFTQVNHTMNEAMVSRAMRLLAPGRDSKVVDFFCGLGNFTLPIARISGKVFGLEGSEGLVARARAGAAANGLAAKTEFAARDLFTFTESDWDALWESQGGIDRILIDPPREGALALSRVLAAAKRVPERVVYVSCNPATLARDCAVLHHEGGWRVRLAGVMNMFPHTGHVESIAVLEPGPKPVRADMPGLTHGGRLLLGGPDLEQGLDQGFRVREPGLQRCL